MDEPKNVAEILIEKKHFNNCLIESFVRLYILYYITIETQRGCLIGKIILPS